ncbi:polymerase delta-interacting protein 3 [Hyperolius riggenbachi]|uniref:polymerase delta-interacting protein 3 n=1 Tax=Hyperolius riggenbachi TaxID=752182 RepID=UPI0035A35C4E
MLEIIWQIPQLKTLSSGVTHPIKGMKINVVNHQPTKQALSQTDVEDEEEDEMQLDIVPAKQMKITAANIMQKRAGISIPLTKVVQNDTYTAPTSIQSIPTAPLQRVKSLTGVSRTLVSKEATSPLQSCSVEPAFSPLEGTKMTVNNLHPRVTEEDIVSLKSLCIHNLALSWLSSYLSNSSFTTAFSESSSTPNHLSVGVPQGVNNPVKVEIQEKKDIQYCRIQESNTFSVQTEEKRDSLAPTTSVWTGLISKGFNTGFCRIG